MIEAVSAADANRSFSSLLRRVREGHSVIVTSHGKPVAKIVPVGERDDRMAQSARASLLARLRTEPVVDVGRWTRDELYEDWSVKVGLDTNVLAYAEGTNGAEMKEAALGLIRMLPSNSVVLPVQTLGELFNVLVLKAKRPAANARAAVLSWQDAYPVIDTSSSIMINAADLATDHKLRIGDAVVLSAAAEAGCRLLLSADLQEGFTWQGVTVTNPFAPAKHALLTALLGVTEPAQNQSREE